MVRHAFRFVEQVVFVVGPESRRSQRGLEELGVVRAGARFDGSGQSSLLFKL